MSVIESAARGGVPIMLSTVADQARSFAFHGEPPPLSEGVESLVEQLDQGGRRRDAESVAALLEQLGPRLSTQADYYAVARILDRDQRWEQARDYYSEAEYLDPRPRRSSDPMRQTLKAVANQKGGVGKTTIAAAVVNDEQIRSAFGRIAWVSIVLAIMVHSIPLIAFMTQCRSVLGKHHR